MSIGDLLQHSDWKTEKHVPVIEAPEAVDSGELFQVTVSIGKEISHPNTTEHHIEWISLYFMAEGEKYPYQVGRYTFDAHGATVEGPNTGPVYTHHQASAWLKTTKPGTLYAESYCNIHGLWESEAQVKVTAGAGAV